MKIAILDDYQGAVAALPCFARLREHEAIILDRPLSRLADWPAGLPEAQALVLLRERTRVDDALLARFPSLRIISQSGPVPHIDLQACTRHGVVVSSGMGGHGTGAEALSPASRATAELTWALVLSAVRHIPREVAALQNGRWQSTLGRNLAGRTLGILGYGQIGATVAGYGRAFGMRVLVWGREASRARAVADGYEAAASRADFFSASDVLSLHLRLSPETRGFVTTADFSLMKPDALFVNTSRAALVETGALEAALRLGRPGTAAVDVFEEEPVLDASDPLISMDNALCTPHLGYVGMEAFEAFYDKAFSQILAFAAGHPVDVRNPEVLGATLQLSASP